MKLTSRPLDMTVTYSRGDLAATALVATVVAVWEGVAGGAFSLRVLLASAALFFTFYLVGSLVAASQTLAAGVLFDLPLRLLVGYAAVNTALLALAWFSPLGMLANFGLLLAPALGLFLAAKERLRVRSQATGLWVTGIALLATTLWCQDSIHPTLQEGESIVFKPWVDGFYHAVHLRIFAASHGAASIDDFRMANVPARLYHYGMYMLPAVVERAAGISSYAAFAGILAPVGVLFTGLAAYAFFGSAWGAWPGVAAAGTLLLLPDGAQQGMGNPFMSYHWLTQISPSATYGLALLAVGWLFVLRGSTRGSFAQLAAGWLVAGVVVAYKLHYFVANLLLLLLIPALSFKARLNRAQRLLLALLAFGFCVLALSAGRAVPDVPVIRFDGSSSGEILRLVLTFARPGRLRDFAGSHMGPHFPITTNLLLGVPYVLLSVLGLLLPLLVILVVKLRGRVELVYLLFPLVLALNFVAMFFGLALDFASSTPDELSHRPLMIVYFFVASSIGGGIGLLLVESRRGAAIAGRVIVASAFVLMAVPARLGPGVQLMWAMPRLSPVRLPAAVVRVAEYLRTHGSPDDVFQDSQFDRLHVVAALSERRPFVAHTLTRVPFRSELVDARSEAIDHFMGQRLPKLVTATAHAFGFRWFLLERGDRVDWPPELADHPVFQTGPFALYEF